MTLCIQCQGEQAFLPPPSPVAVVSVKAPKFMCEWVAERLLFLDSEGENLKSKTKPVE